MQLDLVWPPEEGEPPPLSAAGRLWLGIQFECCAVYSRIYREPQAEAYLGNCPKCRREVRVKVGPGGVASRLFRARIV